TLLPAYRSLWFNYLKIAVSPLTIGSQSQRKDFLTQQSFMLKRIGRSPRQDVDFLCLVQFNIVIRGLTREK
uniref:hypothetical protein n=1 Tax=Brasilonema octagenarum TaxID=417105 RepID=UPI001B7D11A3